MKLYFPLASGNIKKAKIFSEILVKIQKKAYRNELYRVLILNTYQNKSDTNYRANIYIFSYFHNILTGADLFQSLKLSGSSSIHNIPDLKILDCKTCDLKRSFIEEEVVELTFICLQDSSFLHSRLSGENQNTISKFYDRLKSIMHF